MNRFVSAATLAIFAIVLSACASAPPKPVVDFDPEYDFSGKTKVAFYALSGRTTGDNPTQLTGFQKDRINEALAKALALKGITMVDNAEDADLLISWHLNLIDKQDIRTTTSPATGFGMGMGYSRYNRYAMYSCYNCFQETDVRVVDYTQGTFIVDMIDPAKNQSVWRSVTQSKLRDGGLKDQAAVDSAARLVLAAFPPSAGATN